MITLNHKFYSDKERDELNKYSNFLPNKININLETIGKFNTKNIETYLVYVKRRKDESFDKNNDIVYYNQIDNLSIIDQNSIKCGTIDFDKCLKYSVHNIDIYFQIYEKYSLKDLQNWRIVITNEINDEIVADYYTKNMEKTNNTGIQLGTFSFYEEKKAFRFFPLKKEFFNVIL